MSQASALQSFGMRAMWWSSRMGPAEVTRIPGIAGQGAVAIGLKSTAITSVKPWMDGLKQITVLSFVRCWRCCAGNLVPWKSARTANM
eukprot:3820390-Karenia_brevis.AAC.1